MALYLLNTWEDNGYHDSYFHSIVWNSETESVENIQTHATAYGGMTKLELSPLTPEVLEAARLWLKKSVVMQIANEDARMLVNPGVAIKKGDKVITKKDTKKHFKYSFKVGKEWKTETLMVAGKNGKQSKAWQKVPAGTRGEVKWVGQNQFETYYANGYKSLESTLQVMVKFATPFEQGGKKMEVAYFDLVDYISLDQSPMATAEIERKAEYISREYNFKPSVSRHGGWLSTNEAADAAKRFGV